MNSSGKDINIANFISNQRKEFQNVFGQGNVNANLVIRQVQSAEQLNDFESLIDIQKGTKFSKNKDGSITGGDAEYGGKFVRLNAEGIKKDGSLLDKKAAIHEIGHTGGLVHTFDTDKQIRFPSGNVVSTSLQRFDNIAANVEYESNFMNYSSEAANQFNLVPNVLRYFQKTVGKATQGQVQSVINNLYNGNLNYNNIPRQKK